MGHLPLWNPYAFGGHPFLADIQSAIFYPPSLITIFASAPWRFPIYALELEAIFHIFLGGLFTYLFVMRLLKQRFAALVAALTFAYGGYLTSYPVQQLAILEVNVWLPLILWLLSIAWQRWQERGEKRHFIWAGLALGISLLAGHPQSSMYVFYVCILYWSFETYRGGGRLWPKVGLFCLFLLTGLAVAAVQLVPGLEYMLLSTRAQGSYQEMAGGFPLHDLLQVFLPGILSQWSPLYVGILPLLLASLAVYLVRDRRVVFWAVVGSARAAIIAGGQHVPVHTILRIGARVRNLPGAGESGLRVQLRYGYPGRIWHSCTVPFDTQTDKEETQGLQLRAPFGGHRFSGPGVRLSIWLGTGWAGRG